MDVTFSWTLAFRSSYFSNSFLNTGMTRCMMVKRPIPRITSPIMNIRVSFTLIRKHMTMLRIIIMGARTAILIVIWKAFWTFVTSVVILVTRPAVLNLSMLENEKVWMLR